jgi:hypothetical protein
MDKKSDSIYVVFFYEGPEKGDEEEGAEIYDDFSFHIGEGFKNVEKWRLIEANQKLNPEVNRRLNPKGEWLFQIWHHGKAIMKSESVATDDEITSVLTKNHIEKN